MIYTILGMHKSGTTLISQILHESSINMGDFDESKGYDDGNKYERLETHDLNIEVLGCEYKEHSLNISNVITADLPVSMETRGKLKNFIRNTNGKYPQWGFKDPRTCLTYGVWKQMLPEHRIIAIYRHPAELVTHYRRQQNSRLLTNFPVIWKSLHAWYVYNNEMLKILKKSESPYFLTEYNDLMAGDSVIKQLSEFTGTALKDSRDKKMYRSKTNTGLLFKIAATLHRFFYPQDGDVMELYAELGKHKTAC